MFGFQPPADPSLAEHDILTGMGSRIQFDVFRIDQICLPGRVFGQPVFVVGSHHLSGGITAADATALKLTAEITDRLRTLTPYSGRDARFPSLIRITQRGSGGRHGAFSIRGRARRVEPFGGQSKDREAVSS